MVPIRLTHENLRTVTLLQKCRAAPVVVVRMADDDVLDVVRVEPKCRQTIDDGLLPVRNHHRLEQNNAFGCRQRPRGNIVHPNVVEVVEYLKRVDFVRFVVVHRSATTTRSCRARTHGGFDAFVLGLENLFHVYRSCRCAGQKTGA